MKTINSARAYSSLIGHTPDNVRYVYSTEFSLFHFMAFTSLFYLIICTESADHIRQN